MRKINIAWVLVMVLSGCSENGTPNAAEKAPVKIVDGKAKAAEEEKKKQALEEVKRVEEIRDGVVKADELAKDNKNVEAIEQYRKVLAEAKSDHNKAAILLKLARQFKFTEDLDKELAMYERALGLLDKNMPEPAHANIVFEKTRVLAQLGKYEALEKAYAKVLGESFEKSKIMPMDEVLEVHFSTKKSNINRFKVAFQKAYEKGDVPEILRNFKLLKNAENEFADKDAMYEMYGKIKSKGVYQAANSYTLKQMGGAKGAVILDTMHSYVRFLQWQNKPQKALAITRGLRIMPVSNGKLMLEEKIEKINALVEAKPQPQPQPQ